jgi:flagellar hook-basal body complex protein FliE
VALNSLITGVASGPTGTQSFRALEQSGKALTQGDGRTLGVEKPQGGTEFMGLVQDFLGDVNHLQAQSGNALKAFVAGEITDLHQVMVAGKEAAVALDLMIEIRNRVMESYQEIMRIQV